MRGEPVLPSRFVPLFDYPLENDSNIQQLKKMFVFYHEIDHHCGKFDENLLDFNKRLTQSVTDMKELLNSSYTRYSYFEQIPQVTNESIEISDQSTTENNEPLASNIVQEETKSND
jgi:hypothetical protein